MSTKENWFFFINLDLIFVFSRDSHGLDSLATQQGRRKGGVGEVGRPPPPLFGGKFYTFPI